METDEPKSAVASLPDPLNEPPNLRDRGTLPAVPSMRFLGCGLVCVRVKYKLTFIVIESKSVCSVAFH